MLHLYHIIKNHKYSKIITIFVLILLFTFLFCLCPDNEFDGLISLNKKINKINKINNPNNHVNKKINIIDYIFNRFYFVVVSTAMLGYGDICPRTYKTRILTIIYIISVYLVIYL